VTCICPADAGSFTHAERRRLGNWLATAPSAVCSCCGEPLARFDRRGVLVPSSVGTGFATELAAEIRQVVARPLMVVVRADQ
jgi:hypothetical protein